MILLAIETTGQICSAALRLEDGRVFARAEREGLRHLTALIPMVRALLEETGTPKSQLSAIAVSAGPGSFTGIRIGVATARAVAQTLGIPVIKAPTLETFAFLGEPKGGALDVTPSCVVATGSAGPGVRVVCPIFDARRSQLYGGAFVREEDGRVMTLVPAAAWDPPAFFAALDASLAAFARLLRNKARGETVMQKPQVSFMGDGVPVFRQVIEDWQALNRESYGVSAELLPEAIQDARAVLAWAEMLGRPVPYETLEPIYLRKAEAQRKLDDRADIGAAVEAASLGIIRPAEERDVYGISVVERLSFREPWLEQSIRDDLGLSYSDTVICERDGFVLGYAGLHRLEGEGDITNVAVHPATRRQGIASAVLRTLIARAEALGVTAFSLEVRESDSGAIALYEGLGFVREGRRVSYYPTEDGAREDALIMWRRGKTEL